MTSTEIRNRNIDRMTQMGWPVLPYGLPLSEEPRAARLRDLRAIVDRACTLHVLIAVAFGFSRETALRWLRDNGLFGELVPGENEFLEGRSLSDEVDWMKLRIEALWALSWSLKIVPVLDFNQYCGKDLVRQYPDLTRQESTQIVNDRAEVRSLQDICEMEDLAYCLHWAIVTAARQKIGSPLNVRDYVIVQRRHALSWMLSEEPWDEISLNT